MENKKSRLRKIIKNFILPIVFCFLLIITALTTRKIAYSIYIEAKDSLVEIKENSLAWQEAEIRIQRGINIVEELEELVEQDDEGGNIWDDLLKELEELLNKKT